MRKGKSGVLVFLLMSMASFAVAQEWSIESKGIDPAN